MNNCKLCDNPLYFRWTDTHGIGVCANCGLPYAVYHYDKDNKLVNKPPEVAIKESWIPLGQKYWNEFHRMVFPASYDMGILGNRDRSYSGATHADIQQFNEWLEDHENEFPTD